MTSKRTKATTQRSNAVRAVAATAKAGAVLSRHTKKSVAPPRNWIAKQMMSHHQPTPIVVKTKTFDVDALCREILHYCRAAPPSFQELLREFQSLYHGLEQDTGDSDNSNGNNLEAMLKRHILEHLVIAAHQHVVASSTNDASFHMLGAISNEFHGLSGTLIALAKQELRHACHSGDVPTVKFIAESLGVAIPFHCYNDKGKLAPIAEMLDKEVIEYLCSQPRRTVVQQSKSMYPISWTCAITQEVMENPCSVDPPCLHAFEKTSLERWIHRDGKPTCPTCRREITRAIHPNLALLESIQKMGPSATRSPSVSNQPSVTPLATQNLETLLCRLRSYKTAKHILGIVHVMEICQDNGLQKSLLASTQVQLEACSVLFDLSANDPNSRNVIANGGGIPVILAFMMAHKFLANVQLCVCKALCVLASTEKGKRVIADAGGIPTILAAMKVHSTLPHLQENACATLSNLAENNNENKN